MPEALVMTGCDQCQVVAINGIATHEIGCPNSHLNPVTGQPYPRECKWCGQLFVPEEKDQTCCDSSCQGSYYG